MAVMHDVLTLFRSIFRDAYDRLREKKEKKNSKLLDTIMWVVLAVALIYGAYSAYRWHVVRREQTALKMFSESFELYQMAQKNPKQWADVEGAFSLGYEQNSSSKMAPYFKLFQAQALAEQGKQKEAIELTEKTIVTMSKKDKIVPFYATKVALMKMDSDDAGVQQDGINALRGLAYDANNQNRDVALYYLGSYYVHNNDAGQAREAFEALVASQPEESVKRSPFATLAEEQLKSL